VAAKFTTAEVAFGAVCTTIFAGQVIVGGCVSFTVTVKLAVVPAVVVMFTVVVPTGKKDPEAGLTPTIPQVPDVIGAGKFTTAPHWFGSFATVILAGAVIAHVWHTPPPGGADALSPETVTL